MTATLLIRIRASQTEAPRLQPSPAPYRSLFPPLPTQRLSAWHRHTAHVDDALVCCQDACIMRRREGGKEGAKHGRKEEIKRDCTQRLSREWRYNEVLDGFNTSSRRGHCRSQVLLISPLFLKQIKLSGTACVSIRSGWGPVRTAWFRCSEWISR